MAKSLIWAAVLIVSAVLFVGCSDDPSGSSATPPSIAPPPVADVEGIWVGRGTVTGGTQQRVGRKFNLVLTLSQVDSEVTGAVMTGLGMEWDATGTLNGQVLTFTLTQSQPCAGSYSGAGTASNGDSELTGSFSGTDCNGTLSADFTVAIKGSKTP
jgi:type V secretory pathway adhesin AidA